MPARWQFALVRDGAMVGLAKHDRIGALLAVFAASLRVAELSLSTAGWDVIVQVGCCCPTVSATAWRCRRPGRCRSVPSSSQSTGSSPRTAPMPAPERTGRRALRVADG